MSSPDPLQYRSPGGEEATPARGHRTAFTWILLLAVWGAGVVSWGVWVVLIVYVLVCWL